jgi:hypothetical protein
MVFLALMTGVHTIESITLTDIETKHVLTLRYSNTLHSIECKSSMVSCQDVDGYNYP